MTTPLLVLALLSIVAGFIGLPAWLGVNRFNQFLQPSMQFAHSHEQHHYPVALELGLAIASVSVAVLGIFFAYRLYVTRPGSAEALSIRFSRAYNLFSHKYYVDEFYDSLFVNPAVNGSRQLLWKILDVKIIDGVVNGAGHMFMGWARLLKNIQNGMVRGYASWILMGAVGFLFYVYVLARG